MGESINLSTRQRVTAPRRTVANDPIERIRDGTHSTHTGGAPPQVRVCASAMCVLVRACVLPDELVGLRAVCAPSSGQSVAGITNKQPVTFSTSNKKVAGRPGKGCDTTPRPQRTDVTQTYASTQARKRERERERTHPCYFTPPCRGFLM